MNEVELVAIIMVVMIILAAFTLIRVGTHHTVWANSEKPLWKKCELCEGCGVIMLDSNEGGFVPIPLEYRSFYKTVSNAAKYHGVIQGPVANTRTCSICLGMGSAWSYKGKTRVGLPGPTPFEKWDK